MVIGYLKGDRGCVLTDGADHDDPVCDDLVDLLHKRQVEVIGTSDGEVDDVDLSCDRVVKRVEEPGRVRHLWMDGKGG